MNTTKKLMLAGIFLSTLATNAYIYATEFDEAESKETYEAYVIRQTEKTKKHLLYACEYLTPLADITLERSNEHHIKMIENSLQQGANVHEVNAHGLNPLQLIATTGNEYAARLLLEHKADINASPGTTQRSPLHRAVQVADKKMTQLLLEYNATPNTQDHLKESPLENAIKSGDISLAELLIAHKATVNAYQKNTAGIMAENPVFDVTIQNNASEPMIKLLLEHCLDIDNNALENLLRKTVSHGYTHTAQLIIEKYDVSTHLKFLNGNSLLAEAASHGCIETVEMLINCNAQINQKNKNAQTPLALAALNGHSEIVTILLLNNADPASEKKRTKWIIEAQITYQHGLNEYVRLLSLMLSTDDNLLTFMIPIPELRLLICEFVAGAWTRHDRVTALSQPSLNSADEAAEQSN